MQRAGADLAVAPRMILRLTVVSAFLGASLSAVSASAQEPVASEPAAAPPATPPATQAVVEPPPDPPPTATVSNKDACGLVFRSCKVPHLALAIEGGIASFEEDTPFGFNTSIGSRTSTGPAWGARVGVEIFRWFAVDLHYSGMNNHAFGDAAPTGSVHLLTSAGTGELRFTLPLPYVQPYVFGGLGAYATIKTGSTAARAGSALHSTTEPGVPLGVGVSVPIYSGFSAGAELTYHRLLGEEFSKNTSFDGGDLTTANIVLRVRL